MQRHSIQYAAWGGSVVVESYFSGLIAQQGTRGNETVAWPKGVSRSSSVQKAPREYRLLVHEHFLSPSPSRSHHIARHDPQELSTPTVRASSKLLLESRVPDEFSNQIPSFLSVRSKLPSFSSGSASRVRKLVHYPATTTLILPARCAISTLFYTILALVLAQFPIVEMDTTRRSSRAARLSQPLQPASHHSSASSNSSGRADRTTRSNNKTDSPHKSTPSGSLSSEPPEDTIIAVMEEGLQTRRKRNRGDERDKSSKTQVTLIEIANGADDTADDDEAVRCICGLDEYPGPPQLLEEDSKNGIKDGIEDSIIAPADVTEDLAGFFLQCDICKVWQHGGCVGIMNEDTSPEEYFCEECRKDLHKIFIASNGQRYSHYLPLYQSLSRTTSRAASFSKDGTRSPRGSKSGRPSSSVQSAKRRSTMNSRDAAYDEDEQLRRAIEASKGEKSGESVDGGIRRGKRGRSDSEEKPDGPKRQRTISASPSPAREAPQPHSQADSDDGANGRVAGNKKIRGAAARNHREKEMREERERSRQEAANKRKGRAERRRIDDSDPSEELPLAEKATANKNTEVTAQSLDPPPSSQVTALDTPPTQPPVSHRKGGRPPNSRKGKLGKNQYTKDKDLRNEDNISPNRSQSRDITRGDDNISSNKGSNAEGKSGRSKGSGGGKSSMNEMKKRVSGILDYITRTQVEMAGESTPPSDVVESVQPGIVGSSPVMHVNGANGEASGGLQGQNFPEMTSLEMMDSLTKNLIMWQRRFT
ncbi:hypothetical protein B7494_g7133 [Chlorociboria aeruginascens]|nr:hypothetical protein B7494_g7133 [Chlorociboria aeruginascens]